MKIKNLKSVLVAVFVFVGMSAFAETNPKYENVTYEIVTGGGDGTAADKAKWVKVASVEAELTEISIPATFTKTDVSDATTYYKVVGFNNGWTNVTGHKNVTATLTSLTIDATNMPVLDYYAIGLTKLATLTLSSTNAAHVDNTTLTNCTGTDVIASLTSLDLSGCTKMVTINASAFQDWALTSVKLPESIATIGALAFAGTAITTIDLSKTKVTELANGVFYKTKLATISLPEGLTTIKNGAFQESALTTITIPAKVTSIESDAFLKCEALTTADLSAAVDITIINSKTFFGAKALTAITIPAKVTSIGESAFEGCEALATLTMSATELATIGKAAFKGTAITAFEVPATVTSIGESAFEGCKKLATVAFAEESTLTGAQLPASIFKNCEALTSVDLSNLPATFTTIKNSEFDGCVKLAEIILPKTITGIWGSAFKSCVIESLDLSETAMTGTLDQIFGAHDAENPNALKSILLPEGLTGIKAHVFDYSAIEEIDIPATITSNIPDYAFYYCEKLKTVNYEPTASGSSKFFEAKAFLGCTPFVKINTNSFYFDDFLAAYGVSAIGHEPTNATFGVADDLSITPVKDKGKSGKYFAKICPKLNIQISKEDLGDTKLYSVYVDDDGIAYFQALKVKSGVFTIKKGQHVIAKANDETPIEFEIGGAGGSVLEDAIFSFDEKKQTADFQGGSVVAKYSNGANVTFNPGFDYVYALTNSKNNGGFGFTYYTGTTMPAGAFFIVSTLNPNAAGRLETVWLDEDGNVEGEATAINKIQSKTEDGAIYNLQGVRVNAAKKGIYIQNGKKYIMK